MNGPLKHSGRTLTASAVLEFGTGLALLAYPTIVTELLLGSPADGQLGVLARFLGGSLVSLGATVIVGHQAAQARGLLVGYAVYNGVTAVVLSAAAAAGLADGVLLWPVAVFHGGVAAALLPGALSQRRQSLTT